MSVYSDAANQHIMQLLEAEYGRVEKHTPGKKCAAIAYREFMFHPERRWRLDYAISSIKCAIELDGGSFMQVRTGHTTGVGLRAWREKNNAAMTLGWRIWHYAPDEVIKAGRKTLPDEPVLLKLPWVDMMEGTECHIIT